MTQNLESFLDAIAAKYGMTGETQKAAINTHLSERSASDQEMANKIAALFSSPPGAEVLAWLKANTHEKGQVPTDLLLSLRSDQIMQHALFRAGEDSVVEMIELAIAQAKNKPKRKRKAT